MRALFLLIVFLPGVSFSQKVEKIDSLKSELVKATNDSLKIEINNQIFRNLYQYDPENAKQYYLNMLSLARDNKNARGFSEGYFAAAAYFIMFSEYDSALYYFKKSNQYANRLNDSKLQIESLLAIAHTHLWRNETNDAKTAGLESLKLSEKNNDSSNIAISYKNLGEIYSMENNLDSATLFYLKAIKILEKTGTEKTKLGDLYTGIGEVYLNLNEFNKAEEFIDKSISLFERVNDRDGVMYARGMMGGLNFTRKNYKKAIEILLPVLKYYESVGDPYRISETHRYLGLSYLNSNDVSNAEKNLREAVDVGRKADEPINLADALNAYGDLQMKKKNYRKAQQSFEEAEALYAQVNFGKGKLNTTKVLAQLFEETGQFAKATEYLKNYIKLKDSLDLIANASVVQELEAKYQNEKKQHQIELLEAQNQLKEKEKARQRNIFILGVTAAFIIIVLLYILYKNHQRANKKLKELDSLKSRFFANISHEFRTPLTLISGPIENRLQHNDLNSKEKEELEMIHRNSKQLLILVDQLLDLSKIESGGYQLKVERGDVSNFLITLASSFKYPAETNNIDFNISIDQTSEETWFDGDVIQKIVINLLSNALKYTPESGIIYFSTQFQHGDLKIICENSGEGIDEKDIKKVFERFYQQNGKAGGVGIGLALVKELTDLVRGKISVSSIPGQSTTFEVLLPIKKSSFKKEEIHTRTSVATPAVEIVEDYEYQDEDIDSQNDDAPILLIVEDNPEVRKFVKGILQEEYQIIEAENGSEGLKKAVDHIPDLIVSDIMMPDTNGLEMCQNLKTDERTSHIPIILLTAKAGEENELTGYETGADDYITKPFSSELLKVRIEKLIEIRKKLHSRFSQEIVLKPKEISITSADEKFLSKVQEILDKHISNSEFTAEFFSQEIGMSRMQLHRKLKALTGLSTNHFIRLQRLNFAADLLAKPGINISEVGYMAGFSNPSYFAKCFKDHFGTTPTEFAKKG